MKKKYFLGFFPEKVLDTCKENSGAYGALAPKRILYYIYLADPTGWSF